MEIPVTGPAESSMLLATLMGGRFGIVTFHPKAVPDYEKMIRDYGFESRTIARPVRPLRQSPEEQLKALTNPEPAIEDFEEVATALVRDGAEVIIPGCLMLSPLLVKNGVHRVESAPVLDVVSVTVKLAESMYELSKAGLPIISRSGLYQGPEGHLVDEVRAMFPGGGSGTPESRTG